VVAEGYTDSTNCSMRPHAMLMARKLGSDGVDLAWILRVYLRKISQTPRKLVASMSNLY